MPRSKRSVRPRRLIHVITRFLNGEYLLDCAEARVEYLRRAALSFAESDWIWLGHALMSTHVHNVSVSGFTPFGDISRRLHSGFAGWINPRRGRLGPIVAGRPETYEVEPAGCVALLAYVHNNPVRAGVVARAEDSDWTSHRLYLAGCSTSLVNVAYGLELCGLSNSERGRAVFAQEVAQRAGQTRAFVDDNFAASRSDVREQAGPAVELSYAVMTRDGEPVQHPLWQLPGAVTRSRWNGDLGLAIGFIAHCLGIPREEVLSRSRRRPVVRVRRLVVLACCVILGRRIGEVAAALGISSVAARKLQTGARDADLALARDLAERLSLWME